MKSLEQRFKKIIEEHLDYGNVITGELLKAVEDYYLESETKRKLANGVVFDVRVSKIGVSKFLSNLRENENKS